jgi:hypothetical protein
MKQFDMRHLSEWAKDHQVVLLSTSLVMIFSSSIIALLEGFSHLA